MKTSGFFTLFILLFTQCSKSDISKIDSNCTIFNESFLVGKWQLEKAEIKQNGVYVDVTSQLDACQRDDYSHFLANGTFSRVDAGVICSYQLIETGTWKIVNGKLSGNGQVDDVDTIINCNKIIREFTDKYSQKLKYTMIRIP
jgi:hypothetical protein